MRKDKEMNYDTRTTREGNVITNVTIEDSGMFGRKITVRITNFDNKTVLETFTQQNGEGAIESVTTTDLSDKPHIQRQFARHTADSYYQREATNA